MSELRYATLVVVAVLVFLISLDLTIAHAMQCERDALSEVSSSGAILEMLSGQIYRVDDVDQVDSVLWMATEDVLICREAVTVQGKQIAIYKIINKDDGCPGFSGAWSLQLPRRSRINRRSLRMWSPKSSSCRDPVLPRHDSSPRRLP